MSDLQFVLTTTIVLFFMHRFLNERQTNLAVSDVILPFDHLCFRASADFDVISGKNDLPFLKLGHQGQVCTLSIYNYKIKRLNFACSRIRFGLCRVFLTSLGKKIRNHTEIIRSIKVKLLLAKVKVTGSTKIN